MHQKGLVSETKKSKNNALNDLSSLHERDAVAATRKAELLSSASAA